ncbi:GerMN domain-containing protein [Actinomarinicola tropica]|uniref:GerMN domain-containing protein n=1 Tax=Actinomarinicola tropica TaxID=2789776 RepID=A0A5Q2RFF6_9ACTN|nr:GerMN domain-containing protein [Actinomarinicola tropica]QGG95568.1 hypothetical protein GH723_10945 [Actinomarinicola tropica]
MRRRVLGALALVAVVAGCALPSDEGPRTIDDPAALDVMRPSTTTTSTTVEDVSRERILFYFDGREELLAAEERSVPFDATIVDVLNLLTEPPQSSLLRTAVPADVVVAGAELSGDTLLIDLADDALFDAAGNELFRAVAQMVVTAVAFEDGEVADVRFLIDGEPQAVPSGEEGVDTREAVGACDYARFLANRDCTTLPEP